MSRRRGTNLQEELAAYLRANGFPYAESTPNGRRGVDILKVPGINWENKTADEFRVLEFVKHARSNAGELDLPVVVYWPRGAGAMSVADIPTIIPMRWTNRLVRWSGYGDPLEVLPHELGARDGHR